MWHRHAPTDLVHPRSDIPPTLRRRLGAAALLALAAGALILTLPGTVPGALPGAQPAQAPSLNLNPSSASPGDEVQLQARNFRPGGCLATLQWDGKPWDSLRIPAGGSLDGELTVPPGATLGDHRVMLWAEAPCLTSDNEFGLSASADLRVTTVNVARQPKPNLAADLAYSERLVLVRAQFDGRDRVVSQTVTVEDGILPARAVEPRLLRLTARDVNGEVVDEVPGWHPAWTDEWRSDTDHRHLAQPTSIGRFFVPFRRNLGTLDIFDEPRQHLIATVDLVPAITAYCDAHPAEAACTPPGPSLWLTPTAGTVKAGQQMTVTVRARDIKQLYGVQFTLRFDAALAEVVDLDDATPGVQIEPGDFPAPDAVLRNSANNTAGTIEYVATLQGEKPGVSGGGVAATIVLRGKAPGRSNLAFDKVVLSDPMSRPIAVTSYDGSLTVTQLEPEDRSLTVTGRLVLERRPTNAGAQVCVEANCMTTGPDGSYSLTGVLPRILRVTHPSYLRSEREIPVPPGAGPAAAVLPPVTLLGGDVNQDGLIFTQDVVAIGGGWNQTPLDARWRKALDITDDDVVNVLDAVAVQYNLGQRAPGPWPAGGAAAAFGPASTLPEAPGGAPSTPILVAPDADTGVRLAPAQVRVAGRGVPATLDIEVQDVARLFGYHVLVKFDRTMLRVIDANARPSAPGVQVRVGEFLDAENLFVAVNQADNEKGLVSLMVSQTYPAPGRSGTGVLGSIQFDVLAEGSSRVKFEAVELYDDTWPDAQRIPATAAGADVFAGSDHFLMFTPWLSK